VTLATVVTGHITIAKATAYIVAQVLGAVLAHLIQVPPSTPSPFTKDL
jgi:glycerol uptake facilitator-like aquaporin